MCYETYLLGGLEMSPYLLEDKMMKIKYHYIVIKRGPKASIRLKGPGGQKGPSAHCRSYKDGFGVPQTSSIYIIAYVNYLLQYQK